MRVEIHGWVEVVTEDPTAAEQYINDLVLADANITGSELTIEVQR